MRLAGRQRCVRLVVVVWDGDPAVLSPAELSVSKMGLPGQTLLRCLVPAVDSGSAGIARVRGRGRAALVTILALLIAGGPPTAKSEDDYTVFLDAELDFLARPMDPGAEGVFDPEAHRLIDLLELRLGPWAPDDPGTDLFNGQFMTGADFLRLDVVLEGLVNPPGPTRPWEFAPFAYGDHPVYGFIEVDMDRDYDTGGELDAPRYRYLGNVVRFGSMPAVPGLNDRIALDASAFDGDFVSAPFVERSGEEFHLALLGSVLQSADITEIEGGGDAFFDSGETWWIEAPWFHRAHGYEPFSLALGGAHPGEYAPACTVQFEHDLDTDVTWISLVFPFTNIGAGLMRGEVPEPPNADPSDQFSVLEALLDLQQSAVFLDHFPTGLPAEALIKDWQDKDPQAFLLATTWRHMTLLGTSYTEPDPLGEYFVWTDVYPDGIRGDVSGDGEADAHDRDLIQQFIAEEDASDGEVDGRAELSDFAANFSVFDVNHSGVVDDLDRLLVSAPGDLDLDADIDLVDFASLQACAGGPGILVESTTCNLGDLDTDCDVDGDDARRWERFLTGPGKE